MQIGVPAPQLSPRSDRACAAGAYDVLYKPFYAKDIDALMSRALGLARAK
jgi:hypothetical protein